MCVCVCVCVCVRERERELRLQMATNRQVEILKQTECIKHGVRSKTMTLCSKCVIGLQHEACMTRYITLVILDKLMHS